MPESTRDFTVSRIGLLELQDEQRLVKEGYELLDQKRILLAAEIRRQLQRLRVSRSDSQRAETAARSAVRAAVARHGLDELWVYPPLSATDDQLQFTHSRLFGLDLIEAHWQAGAVARLLEQPVNPSAEAHASAVAFRAWLAPLVEIAACCVNLRRLVRDYIRTERRASAIENVLQPEIDSGLKFIEEQLEGLDQEETTRVRQQRPRLEI